MQCSHAHRLARVHLLDSFVTIGPTVLLAILSITFHIGSQKRFLDQAKPLYPTLDTSDISGSERSQSCTPLPGDMDVEASSHNVDRFGGIQKGSSVQSVASDQPTKRSLDWESMSISWSKWERVIPGMNPPSRGIGPSQPSRQSIWRTGPGKCPDGDQVRSCHRCVVSAAMRRLCEIQLFYCGTSLRSHG